MEKVKEIAESICRKFRKEWDKNNYTFSDGKGIETWFKNQIINNLSQYFEKLDKQLCPTIEVGGWIPVITGNDIPQSVLPEEHEVIVRVQYSDCVDVTTGVLYKGKWKTPSLYNFNLSGPGIVTHFQFLPSKDL